MGRFGDVFEAEMVRVGLDTEVKRARGMVIMRCYVSIALLAGCLIWGLNNPYAWAPVWVLTATGVFAAWNAYKAWQVHEVTGDAEYA